MPIQHAVLSLLEEGPGYGYEFRAKFEADVGPEWGGLNIGHMYQVLGRAERDGLVLVTGKQNQANRPEQKIYAITDAGVESLNEWFDDPPGRSSGYRSDFILKVQAAHKRGPEMVRHVCEIHRAAHMSELQTLRALRRARRGEDELGSLLTITAAIAHIQADIEIIDSVEAGLDKEESAQASATGAGQPARSRTTVETATSDDEPRKVG
ncbi:MAG: PadR family transcriptional regulator [Galbitalea sp.]